MASSAKVMAALRVPTVIGENLTPKVQELPAASVDPHVFALIEKSVAAVPVTAIPVKVTVALPVFCTEKLCAALLVPIFCTAKVKLDGVKLSVLTGATWPVPLKLTL